MIQILMINTFNMACQSHLIRKPGAQLLLLTRPTGRPCLFSPAGPFHISQCMSLPCARRWSASTTPACVQSGPATCAPRPLRGAHTFTKPGRQSMPSLRPRTYSPYPLPSKAGQVQNSFKWTGHSKTLVGLASSNVLAPYVGCPDAALSTFNSKDNSMKIGTRVSYRPFHNRRGQRSGPLYITTTTSQPFYDSEGLNQCRIACSPNLVPVASLKIYPPKRIP